MYLVLYILLLVPVVITCVLEILRFKAEKQQAGQLIETLKKTQTAQAADPMAMMSQLFGGTHETDYDHVDTGQYDD